MRTPPKEYCGYLLLTEVDVKASFLCCSCKISLRVEVNTNLCVLCDKKMNTKVQHTHTHQHLVKADITMRFKESAKRALNLMLFSYSLEQQYSIGNDPPYGWIGYG